MGRIDPADHGHDGPLLTTTTGFPFPFDDLVVETSKTPINEFNFSYNEDVNSGNTIGTCANTIFLSCPLALTLNFELGFSGMFFHERCDSEERK